MHVFKTSALFLGQGPVGCGTWADEGKQLNNFRTGGHVEKPNATEAQLKCSEMQ